MALARETSRIGLGALVTSVTFGLPGLLAIAVAQVDAMSGGRVELGLGTGWFEPEHKQRTVKLTISGLNWASAHASYGLQQARSRGYRAVTAAVPAT